MAPPTPAQTVAAILAAQYKPLDYAQQRAQAQAAKEQAALQAANLALVHQLQGGVNAAAPAYDAAVNQTSDLARSAAGLLAGANPNPQVQADLQAIGAPPGQGAQLADQLGQGFGGQGAVLNIMQGSIPGASLVAQKAAEQGYLAGLPTVAALQGQQNLRSLLARSADSRDKYVEARMGVAGQAASLLPQLLQQRTENRQADRSFGLQKRQVADAERQDRIAAMWTQRKFDADQAAQAAQLKADEAAARAQATGDAQDRADANYWKGIAATQNQERIAIDRRRATATAADPKTGLTPYQKAEIGLSQQRIDISKRKAGSSGTNGLTGTQVRAARAKGNQLTAFVKEARAGFNAQKKDKNGDLIFDHAPTYDEAVQLAEQRNIPLDIAVPMLNRVFPAQYEVTDRGLKQIGIRGYPSWKPGGKRKRNRKRK